MPDLRTNTRRAGIATVVSAAVILAAPLAQHFEGYVAKARPDPAGIPTYCYGETERVDPSRIYSKSECGDLLRERMARDYAPKLLACVPSLADHPKAFGSALDAAYNAGPAALCKSPMALAFNRGDYATGCNAFAGWYVTARDRRTGERKTLPGLVRRRLSERQLCRGDT